MRKSNLIAATANAEPARRAFLRGSGVLAGGAVAVSATTLATLSAHAAWATDGEHDKSSRGRRSDYGALHPTPDQNGDHILALPRDFHYVSFSKTGDPFGNSLRVPAAHDGMACFAGPGRAIRLIRNHELRSAGDPFSVASTGARRYDPLGSGGCMTLDFDPRTRQLARQFVSIGGTIVNCAGGYAWRNAGWLTCEETTAGPEQGWGRKHGYVFLVPAAANAAVHATPFTAMGRFAHEAALADARGIVYQTEDAGNASGFYRFLPHRRENLAAGGVLQMLAVKDSPQANLYVGQMVGLRLPVEWVDIDIPDPELEAGAASCFAQARARGGAAFNRLEGIWRGLDGRSIYFVSTSGGEGPYGQLWHYVPGDAALQEGDSLVLVFQSPLGSVLDSPDNICVTPNGGILFCEDDASGDDDTHPLAPGITDVNRIVGLGLAGEPFEFAVNIFSASEFAGACFSPDGDILFVNIQGGSVASSGMTLAIWGPWERGPL